MCRAGVAHAAQGLLVGAAGLVSCCGHGAALQPHCGGHSRSRSHSPRGGWRAQDGLSLQLINLQDFTSTALPSALAFRGRSIIAAVGDRIMRIGAWRSRARRLRTAVCACAAGVSELGVLFRSVDVLNVGLIGASVRGTPRRALPERGRAPHASRVPARARLRWAAAATGSAQLALIGPAPRWSLRWSALRWPRLSS